MKGTKRSVLVILCILMITFMSACSRTEDKTSNTVTLWASGSDNVKVMFEKQIENFNKTNSQYEVKLEFITSGTGAQSLPDRIAAAVKAGKTNTNYDIIELNETDVINYELLAGENALLEIDRSNMKNIDLLKYEGKYRNDLFIPYRGTTVVLAYNSETVKNPPKTAEDLYQWIKDNPSRFAYNTPGSGGAGNSFVVTSCYNFLEEEALTSIDDKYISQWDKCFELMTELHPYMYQSSGKVIYPNKNQGTLDLLANKEIDMCPAWADMVISQKIQGTMPEEISIIQIEPAFTGNVVGFSIPSIGSNKAGAEAFIDYMLSPEAQNIALESMAALPVIDFNKLDKDLLKNISSLDIKEFRLSSIGENSNKLVEKWNQEIGTLD